MGELNDLAKNVITEADVGKSDSDSSSSDHW